MAQKEYFGLEKETFLWLYLEIKVLKTFQYHLNPVQHLVDRAAENTDIVKIEQECEILLISKTHLHEVTETCSHIRQTKWHASKLVETRQACTESCLMDVSLIHSQLKVPLSQIK